MEAPGVRSTRTPGSAQPLGPALRVRPRSRPFCPLQRGQRCQVGSRGALPFRWRRRQVCPASRLVAGCLRLRMKELVGKGFRRVRGPRRRPESRRLRAEGGGDRVLGGSRPAASSGAGGRRHNHASTPPAPRADPPRHAHAGPRGLWRVRTWGGGVCANAGNHGCQTGPYLGLSSHSASTRGRGKVPGHL